MTKTFEIHGEWEASDIDDAVMWLGEHFTAVANGSDPNDRKCQFVIAVREPADD